jgi:hypothetical protein
VHYHKWRASNNKKETKISFEICTFEGCDRPHKAKGLCHQHYIHKLRGKTPHKIGQPKYNRKAVYKGTTCDVTSCESEAEAKGMCNSHYRAWRRFGVTAAQYNEMYSSQNGRCAICLGEENNKRLSVDHCHQSGNVRGLLCSNCNLGIGKLQENTDNLLRAIDYLSRKPIRQVA